jgi:hypothetical protein
MRKFAYFCPLKYEKKMNRIMKRKATALSLCMAAALLLGLSQCKKQETPITPSTPEETEEGIHITLDVEDGSKHVVIPGTNTAVVNYSFGDKIYVGDGSKYIGTLTNTGSTGGTSSHFEGTILSPSSETLHFYFVGGLETGTLTKGSTTTFNVDISDQSSNLPVLSYGNAPYAKDATSYTCMLMNQCGLVKVEFAVATSEVVSLSASPSGQDFLTHANINFDLNDNSAIVPTADPTGNPSSINLYSQNGRKKWAILLPQALPNETESVQAIVTIGTGTNIYTYNVKVPEITESIYTSIINEEYVPEGNIIYNCGPVFSVSDDKFVSFSKGNLQYQPSSSSTPWRFADYQWDYVGTHPEGQTGYGTVPNSDNAKILEKDYSGWLDLFGWGTWGSNGNPLNISTDIEDYTWSEFTETLDGHNDWRTLSYNEWKYLLNTRPVASEKYVLATVNDVDGYVFLPDNWIGDTFDGIYWGDFAGTQWGEMEDKGAVFLPAAGVRTVSINNTQVDPPTTTTDTLINVNVHGEFGNMGYYWINNSIYHYLWFDESLIWPDQVGGYSPNHSIGCAVRLVRDIE